MKGMITEELLNFIRAQYAAHMSVEEMKRLLITEGEWNDEDVNEALKTLGIPLTPAPSVSEADDFLGIFSASKVVEQEPVERSAALPSEKPIEFAPAPVAVKVNAPPSPSPTPTPAPAPAPVSASPIPEILPSEIKFTPPPSSTRHVIPLQPASSPPKAKFDLSMFRKNVSSGAALPASQAGAGNEVLPDRTPKTVKTKSIAEAWLQGKGVSPLASDKPRGPITWEGKTPLVAIRTMESDVLTHGKADKVLPGEPAPAMPSVTIKEVIEEARQKEKVNAARAEKYTIRDQHEAVAEKSEQTEQEIGAEHNEQNFAQMAAPKDAEAEEDNLGDIALFNKNVLVVPSGHTMEKWTGGAGILDKLGKKVNTKSIAEMWQQDAEETVQGLSKTGSRTAEDGSEERPAASAGLLLRGKGKTIPGIPALFVPPVPSNEVLKKKDKEADLKKDPTEPTAKLDAAHEEAINIPHFVVPGRSAAGEGTEGSPIANISRTPMEIVTHQDEKGGRHEFIETLVEKKVMKKVLPFAVGALVLLLFIIGILYAVLKLRGPNVETLLTSAVQQFYGLTAFGYHGGGAVDLTLSSAAEGERTEGKIKFLLDYKGQLQNGENGYGDGAHRVKFTGGLVSNDLTWETDINADVIMIGQTLYFHILSLPEGIDADSELFKTYWVAVDLSEIARELALDGLKTALDEYGGFAREHVTFNEAIEKNFPFAVDKRLADEMQEGVMTHRFRLKSDPDRMAEFIRTIYRTYINKELALNVNQELRFKHALEKIGGDVWVNKETGALVKFAFAGDLDDDVAGVHLKGPLSFSFAFADFNKPVTVDKPSPILTLEETRVRMDDYKSVMEKRTRDTPHIALLHTIEKALADYFAQRGRYPTILAELTAAKFMDPAVVDNAILKTYFYMPYVNGALLMNSTRCTASGKVCAYYHLGVNLEDTAHPELARDADITSGIRGKDTSGCGAEKGFSCFDVVAPVNSTSTQP